MIRPYTPQDAEGVLALNAECQPEVGPMDEAKLAAFVEWAPYFKVAADDDGTIVGLLIGLDQTAPYGSPNYGWFVNRFDRFAYVDRIAVSAAARGQGLGPAFYDDFKAWAVDAALPRLTAEVNVVPPNPRSVRFHEIYGFNQIEEFEPTNSPDYRVVMLECPLGVG